MMALGPFLSSIILAVLAVSRAFTGPAWAAVILAVCAVANFVTALIMARAAAYRRDADEHGDNDAQNR